MPNCNYPKIILTIFCGLILAYTCEARNASFVRTDKDVIAIVFFNDDVGLLRIKKRSATSDDNFLVALGEEDRQKIRAMVSNTNVGEVNEAMNKLNELASNNNFAHDQERTRLGFMMKFVQYHAILLGKESTIKINLGYPFFPEFVMNFSGLETAMANYRSAPADKKGERLFFSITSTDPKVAIYLYVPDYAR